MTCCPVVLVAALFIFSAAFISADLQSGSSYHNPSEKERTDSTCKVLRYGKLTQFKGDGVGNNLELPCKYRMAQVTIGGLRVKVSVANGLDPGAAHRFSPSKVAVKIVNENGKRKRWVAKSSCQRLERATTGAVDAWNIRRSAFTPDIVNFDSSRVAVVQQNGVFKVTFSCPVLGSDDNTTGVVITVFGNDMTSSPYPDYMCGNGTTFSFLQRRQELFGDDYLATNRSMVFSYDILIRRRRHGRACRRIARKFRRCPEKAKAIRICSPIFLSRPVSKCLMDVINPETSFLNCLRAVCDLDEAACQAVNEKISRSNVGVCSGLNLVGCSSQSLAVDLLK